MTELQEACLNLDIEGIFCKATLADSVLVKIKVEGLQATCRSFRLKLPFTKKPTDRHRFSGLFDYASGYRAISLAALAFGAFGASAGAAAGAAT